MPKCAEITINMTNFTGDLMKIKQKIMDILMWADGVDLDSTDVSYDENDYEEEGG